MKVKAPDTKTEGMGLEVDKTKGKFKLPKVTMPDINVSLPKVSGPEINLKGPKVETDVSLSKPETDIKGPSLETTADIPVVEPEGKTKFQMPHIKIPSFGFSKPEMKSRKLSGDQTLPSVDVALKKPDIDIDAPKISADVPSVDVKLLDAELTVSGQAPSVDVKGLSVEVEGPDVDGQGSKFKMPKFGTSFPKVKAAGLEISTSKPDVDKTLPEAQLKAQLPSAELEAPSVEGEVEIPEVDVKGPNIKIKKSKISFPMFGSSKTEVKTSESDIPKGEISLPQVNAEVEAPKVDMKSPDVDVKVDAGMGDSPSKFRLPSIKLPKFGAVKGKVASVDVSGDINVPEVEAPSDEVAIEVKAPDTELEDPTRTMSVPEAKTEVHSDIPDIESSRTDPHTSPSKFKFPSFKMPKFSFSPVKRKPSDAEANVEKMDTGDKIPEITCEGVDVDKRTIDVSKEKTSSFSLSFQKPRSRDMSPSESKGDTHSGKQPPLGSAKTEHHTAEISLEIPGADKGHPPEKIEEPEKSSKFSLPSFGDIFKGLELEFYVPTLEEADQSVASRDEISSATKEHVSQVRKTEKDLHRADAEIGATIPTAEMSTEAQTVTKEEGKDKSKFKFWFPRIGFSESLEESKAVTADTEVEKRDMLPETQQEEETDEHKTDVKEEKGSWFTFPKFGMSSPSKTPKETEITVSSPKDNLDKGTDGDAAEDISLTSSVKSSDAFADISSTITSEQVGLSETSPEKVTVKYSEPSVIVGVGQVKTPSEVITSTARTELIRLEPQLPDPVTVCVTSPSQDTLTDTGDIHIVTSNIQALPGTEHATIITKFETVGTVPLGKGSLKTAAAPWTVEAPAESAKESSGEKEIVEKHVIKEMTVDDKGTVVITEKVTHAAHAASEGPDGEDATSAVKKLKDSMHSEKMRFFDAAET
ncbi:neuroblast differentiation-associated protein AHNAK-like [Brienomyrus brachyistius]|uniref:neuroblast differentiation-associated protein AHNAK-like n=1 Tax=Brienomyrus brachyistius TaxID=42636 RepID=UPI0020B34843|nr:neuroblast differentiation-associated protein AHNAK-like [Brienomyrus brachyistius]